MIIIIDVIFMMLNIFQLQAKYVIKQKKSGQILKKLLLDINKILMIIMYLIIIHLI